MRVGSGVILFQLAGFLTSALADFYFAKHSQLLEQPRSSDYFQFRHLVLRISLSPLQVRYPCSG